MVINLSHDDVRLMRNAEIRAEIDRNHLIEAVRQPAQCAATPRSVISAPASLHHVMVGIRDGMRQAITWLAAHASIG